MNHSSSESVNRVDMIGAAMKLYKRITRRKPNKNTLVRHNCFFYVKPQLSLVHYKLLASSEGNQCCDLKPVVPAFF